MDSYWTKRVLDIEPEPNTDETPAHDLHDAGFLKCRYSEISLHSFSFQSLYFVLLFVEVIEASEDINVQ
jgi:hypothetical protein